MDFVIVGIACIVINSWGLSWNLSDFMKLRIEGLVRSRHLVVGIKVGIDVYGYTYPYTKVSNYSCMNFFLSKFNSRKFLF